MSQPRSPAASAARSAVTRSRLALATVAFAGLVIYASLVPLVERPSGARATWAHLLASWPPTVTSKTDVAANIILQIPFGFLMAGTIAHGRVKWQGAAVFFTTVAAALLAFAIELAQGMFSARTPSTSDVLAESLGAMLGALAWMRAGEGLGEFADYRWRALGSPALVLLGGYLTVWTLWQWLPFDFTLRLPELAHKYRAGLMSLRPHANIDGDALVTLQAAARQWLLAFPIGAAAWLTVRRQRRRRTDAAILTGCGVTLAVYFGGLLTVSGTVDFAAIGAAGLGAAVGVWWAERRSRLLNVAAAAAALGALAIDQWAPFTFSATARPMALLPLASYLSTSAADAVSQALLKLQLGFAAAFAIGGLVPPSSYCWTRAAVCIAACAVIETGQMFLPGRFPDVTDLLILSIGAAAGLATATVFEADRNARTHVDAERGPSAATPTPSTVISSEGNV